MKKRLIPFVILNFVLFACSDSDLDANYNFVECSQLPLVSQDSFLLAQSDDFDILEYSVTENCLNIFFNSGGCQGDTWEVRLISGELDSQDGVYPIRMTLKNQELCEAIVHKDVSFDLQIFQLPNQSESELSFLIDTTYVSIIYTY